MDISLYGRVIWRFRWLVAPGVHLGDRARCAVACQGLQSWPVVSEARGLAELNYRSAHPARVSSGGEPSSLQASRGHEWPGWLSGLTGLYAQFANSDQVKALMLRDGASKNWKLTAAPVIPAGIVIGAARGRSSPVLRTRRRALYGRRSWVGRPSCNTSRASRQAPPSRTTRGSIFRFFKTRRPRSRSTEEEDPRHRHLSRGHQRHDRSRFHARECSAEE